MKHKIIVICILFFFILFLPLSAVNMQKIFPIESEIYEALTFLYMEQGKSVPSSTGPWSADELIKMLERINRASLSPAGRYTYDFVKNKLSEPPRFQPSTSFGAYAGLDITLEGYMHTNTAGSGFFTDERDWIYDHEARKPFLNIPFESWTTDAIYGYFELPISLNQFHTVNDTSYIFNHPFTTNVIFIPPNQLIDLNANVPYRAFISAGGDHWNLQFGRDKVGWGSGQTGNLIVGGHLLYNDYLKFTTYHPAYKFTTIAMAFPHPIDYGYSGQSDNSGSIGDPEDQSNPINGLRMFIAHRLEIRILDIINLTLSEGIMYMSEDSTFDLRFLNPFMIYHNTNIRANANSILGLDIEINPWENLVIYGQFVLDEFSLPRELVEVPGANPEAIGYLCGIKGILPLDEGAVFGSFEVALTDPYLYLRDIGDGKQNPGEYGINYVIGIREFTPPVTNISIMEDFLGYEYGNDVVVFNLNGGYTVFDRFRIEGNVFYLLHGTHDMYTLWAIGSNSDPDDPTLVSTPTTTPASSGNHDPASNSRDAVEYTLALGMKGSYQILENLEVYSQADWIYKINPGNFSTNVPVSDLQVTVGASYRL